MKILSLVVGWFLVPRNQKIYYAFDSRKINIELMRLVIHVFKTINKPPLHHVIIDLNIEITTQLHLLYPSTRIFFYYCLYILLRNSPVNNFAIRIESSFFGSMARYTVGNQNGSFQRKCALPVPFG